MTANRLAGESSPYLLQHRDNPVHWQPWDDAAFDLARRSNRPVLLSVGYAACHWCHVMAHESFENPQIADLMNALFVNIKLDREERPDLDGLYQSALHLMGQHGGWPLTMFLTPDGAPFWGGTYFPPTARWGRPGFPDVLRGIARAYAAETDNVLANVTSLRAALARGAAELPPDPESALAPQDLDLIGHSILRMVDRAKGGLSGAPKFPQPALFRFLWSCFDRSRSTLFSEAVTTTLDHICQGGIYDHLGGGFARYSTDEDWLVPHFEKMLYDNAQLIELLTLVGRPAGNRLYEIRVAECIAWMIREMTVSDGDGRAFAGTLDADSEGEEGRFYLWTEAEVDAVLGADAPRFKAVYDVTRSGNWEGASILNRGARRALGPESEEAALAEARGRLLAARAARVRPARDDKVLADWNGMAIAALATAGAAHDRADWIDLAREVHAFVRRNLTAADGRLIHAWAGGPTRHPAVLDDYAQMIRAALALYEVTGAPAFLDQALDWLDVVERHYRDGGSYCLSADDTGDLLVRPRPLFDNATPSGNGVMAGNLVRLGLLTGRTDLLERAGALLASLAAGPRDRLANQPTALCAFDLLHRGVQVVVVAHPEAAAPFRRAVFGAATPSRVFQRIDPEAVLPAGHPAQGKTAIDGRPTAYLCVGRTCGMPITDPNALSEALERL